MTTQTPLGLWWTKTMGIAEATRSASLIRRASPLMASVVVETSFGGGSVAKETFVRDLVVDGESTWVMWPPMSTTPVASRAPTIPADHAPARVGVAPFIVGVVEVVFRFDHVVRISKQAALGASGTPPRGRHLDVGHVR